MASRHDEREKFPPETDLFTPGLLFYRVGNLHFVEWGRKVCCCLFVWDKTKKKKKKKRKRFSLPGQSSFLNTFGVFFSSGSAAICVHACVCVCVCVCLPQLHFVDDAVTAVGILDAYQSLSGQKKETIYLFLRQTHAGMHTNRHTHTLILQPPPPSSLLPCVALVGCLGSSRNRECVTKHILSDSHAIFPWSRPRLPFMLRLPVILRRRLLWIRGPAVWSEAVLHYSSYTHQLIPAPGLKVSCVNREMICFHIM